MRIRVSAPLVLYVDPAIGDDSGDCLSEIAACKTIQAAYDKIVSDYDHAGFIPTIQLLDGFYDKGVVTQGTLVGTYLLNITGHVGDARKVTIQPPPGDAAFVAQDLSIINVGHLKIQGPGVIGVIARQTPASDAGYIVFGSMPGGTAFNAQSSGGLNISGQIVIEGDQGVHWSLTGASRITIGSNVTYSFLAPVRIGTFLSSGGNSHLEFLAPIPMGGIVHGQSYNLGGGSTVSLNGNVIPGDIPGIVQPGWPF